MGDLQTPTMEKDKETILRELFELKEENRLLQEEKDSLYRDRELAGELGKTLLEQNGELECKLEEMNAEFTSIIMKMEDIKQENHKYRSRLVTETKAKDHHVFEIENIKERLQKEFDEQKKAQQISSEKKVKELRKEIDSQQNDINKHQMVENQKQEKIAQQDEMLENLRKYNKQLQFAANFETDLEEQRRLCSDLQIERDSLLMAMSDLKNIREQLMFDKKGISESYASLQEEIQEKVRQAQMWYNCLQEARQEAGEFKAELDMIKAEVGNKNFKEKGNSLFGEVEDRRLELERKYKTLQTQHEYLVKTYTVTKQHLQTLKNQVASLLQVKGNTADVSQLQRLKQALARKEGEVKMLIEKLNNMEKKQNENSLTGRLKEFHDAFSDFGDKKDYVNFLEMQLEDSKKKSSEMQKELQTKTLLQLAESDRLRHSETQLHNAESNLEKFKTENMRLKLRMEDLRMKLQKELKSKAAGEEAKDSIKTTSTRTSNQGMAKSTSASSFMKKTRASLSQTGPVQTKKTCVAMIETPKSVASVRPIQKVTPMVTMKTSVSAHSESLFNEIAASQGGVSMEEQVVVHAGPSAQHSVRFSDMDHHGQARESQEAVKENSHQQTETTEGGKATESINKNKNTVGVRGQKHAPTVIHIGKGATKNECPQQ